MEKKLWPKYDFALKKRIFRKILFFQRESTPVSQLFFNMNPLELAQKLLRDGYVVVPGVNGTSMREIIEDVMLRAPEVKQRVRLCDVNATKRFVCGGTSFVGLPTVFHAAETRRWHHETAAMLMPMFQELAELSEIPEVKLARILFDRIQIRPAGESPSAESFHRDLPGMEEEDGVDEICIGGFQNCDTANQKLCGIKGSHLTDPPPGTGFAKIDKAGQKHYAQMLAAQANQSDTDSKGKIIVPPGHLILFVNAMRIKGKRGGLVHAVNPTKVPYTSVKIFFGARLTTAETTGMVGEDKERLSFELLEQRMRDNDVIPLGSGQTPAFYPGMYHVFPDKLLPIAKRVVDEMLVPGAMRYPFEQANSRHDYTRSTKSLKDMGVPLHPAYRPDEFACMRPQRDVQIYNFKTGEVDTYPLKRQRIA